MSLAANLDQPVPMPRGRRRTELVMLLFALALVLFAYAAVGLGLKGKLPGLPTGILIFGVVVLAAHLAVRRFAPYADPLLLPLAAVLNGLGIVMIYRLQESGRNGNSGQLVTDMSSSASTTQLLYTVVGIVALVVVLVLISEARVLQRYTYTLGAVGLVLLAIPAFLPASHSVVNGAKVWIIISGSFSVEPGEFARLALAVFFAGYLVAKRDVLALAGRRVLGIDLPRARDLGPVLIAWAASLLVLIFETDIGTSALFFGMFIVMLYIATQRTSWVLIGVLLFLAGSWLTALLFSHVMERFTIWLHPFAGSNPTGIAFQPVQALEGLAFGTGLGQGQPYHTPLVQSDFIFSAFGEELGLVGVMALLLVFGLLVQRGLSAAIAVKDPFSKLLVGGLAFVLALQVFVIVGGVSGLIPLTGITTPFLSQGGSSLVASWILIALMIRVSDSARKPAPQPIQDEGMTQVVRAA
jgi:cell division protein FtsW (lipid II flippase)